MRRASMLLVLAAAGILCGRAQGTNEHRFEDYAVTERFEGKSASPRLVTPEQNRYRSRIRNAVATGSDLWIGSWKNATKASGPNFAGHYFAIRWGCGSQCVMMAIVDAKTGSIYSPPLSRVGELYVPLDNLSDMEIDCRPESSLMVLNNACGDFRDRKSCGRYSFEWRENRFSLVKVTQQNPLSAQ